MQRVNDRDRTTDPHSGARDARTRNPVTTGADDGIADRVAALRFRNDGSESGSPPRELRAPDIELLHKAVAQLLLTPTAQWRTDLPAADESPASPDEIDYPQSDAEWTAFRHSIVRRLSATMGQPARCVRAACRRSDRCTGDPPDCWPDVPPLATNEEVAFIQYVLKSLIEARLNGGAGASQAEGE